MIKIWLLLIFISTSSWGQRSLSREAFQANVRPALNGIVNDFYQMIGIFPDFPKEIVKTVEAVDALFADKENLRTSCPRKLDANCMIIVDSIRNQLRSIESKSLQLMALSHVSPSLYINSLSGMRLISDFHLSLTQVKSKLDNASFLNRAGISDKKETFSIIKELDEMQTLLSLAVVEFIPFIYRDDFRHFYINFIHPIQLHISKNRNYEFLNRNVNSLNFSINLLIMNLTKRNKKTPDGMAPYLSLIHNRWNSLLRYYF
jgi:hypothetical protein